MILRRWKFWAILLIGSTSVGLLESAQVYTSSLVLGSGYTWWQSLAMTLPSWYILAALIPAIVLLSRRFTLGQRQWRGALLVHIGAAVAFSLVHIAGSTWLTRELLSVVAMNPFAQMLSVQLGIYFVVDMVTYFALVGGYHAYDYGRRYNERERTAAQLALRTSRLEASLALANLDSLRMQLNPHFLFNTLNAIAVLALKGERQGVVRMLTLLSDLLRLSLDQRDQLVTLREELEFLDLYLEIEQVRFKDRLTIERAVEPEALDAEVPSLLLQPLVENAIKHGISRQTGPGTIRIEGHIVNGDTLELRVLDTGPGFGASRTEQNRAGVGTANTSARLEQLYGMNHSLELCDRPEGGACVAVRLPLRIVMTDLVAEPPLRSASA
ncbi:MAG TPA: histidine kinase [Longimicrobiales bacterium]|nr:histidine kinase [Longimicrobiales bacterium]